MQVDGHIECFHAGPKAPYRRLVEVLGGVHVVNVRIAVDHRPLEAELRDGALQLITSGAHVVLGSVSVCRIGQRKRHFGSLSPRAIFGVSFSGDAVAAGKRAMSAAGLLYL